MSQTTTYEISTKFLSLGLYYYITGRAAVFWGFQPVCGNLYHLAFELFLKAGLRKKYTEKELANTQKFGHNLKNLWEEFKKIYSDTRLDKFDELIQDIDRWEKIRYLDFPEKFWALSFGVDFDRESKERIKKNMVQLRENGQEHYSFMFDDADELFSVLLSVMSINPKFLKSYLIKQESLGFYLQGNNYPVFDH